MASLFTHNPEVGGREREDQQRVTEGRPIKTGRSEKYKKAKSMEAGTPRGGGGGGLQAKKAGGGVEDQTSSGGGPNVLCKELGGKSLGGEERWEKEHTSLNEKMPKGIMYKKSSRSEKTFYEDPSPTSPPKESFEGIKARLTSPREGRKKMGGSRESTLIGETTTGGPLGSLGEEN